MSAKMQIGLDDPAVDITIPAGDYATCIYNMYTAPTDAAETDKREIYNKVNAATETFYKKIAKYDFAKNAGEGDTAED
jgi:hypothetical protein